MRDHKSLIYPKLTNLRCQTEATDPPSSRSERHRRTGKEIDRLVYELYGLTAEGVKIVKQP